MISFLDPSPCSTGPCCWSSSQMHKMLVHHAVFLRYHVWSSLGLSNLVWRGSSIFCLSPVHCHQVKVAKKLSRVSHTSSRSVGVNMAADAARSLASVRHRSWQNTGLAAVSAAMKGFLEPATIDMIGFLKAVANSIKKSTETSPHP